MEQRLECSIVRDLLPNYIEKMTSRETELKMREHLSTCKECRRMYEEMRADVPSEKAPEIKNFKKYLGWTQLKYIYWGIGALGGIGIFVSLLVDLLVNRSLTWSIIVTSSVIYGFAVLGTLIKVKKHKFLGGMFTASILIIPLLAAIQNAMTQMSLVQVEWFSKIGLPVALSWIAIIWAVVLIQRIFHLNPFNTIAVLAIFSIPGNIVTNYLSEYTKYTQVSAIVGQTLSSISTVLFASVCVFVGRWYYRKKDKVR